MRHHYLLPDPNDPAYPFDQDDDVDELMDQAESDRENFMRENYDDRDR